ncbi:MAG: protein translocase subunit SecD [Pseudomonadota bacterium]
MLYFAPWKKFLVLAICLAGIIFTIPNLFYSTADNASRAIKAIEAERYAEAPQFQNRSPEELERLKLPSVETLTEQADAWPSWLPPNVINLGLDLRGGVHLLVEVKVEEVFAERYTNLRSDIFNELRQERIRRKIRVLDEGIRVEIVNPEDAERAEEIIGRLAQPVGGGIAGGFGLADAGLGQVDLDITRDGQDIWVTLSEGGKAEITNRTMAQSVEIMRRRIDETGTREPTIQRQGERRILIQVPGLGSSAELLDIIGRTAKLTFHEVVAAGGNDAPGPGESVVQDVDGLPYVIKDAAILTGENLVDAQLGFHPDTGLPVVNFTFDSAGARIFGEYTAANVGRLFAVVLDGQIITAPRIQSPIFGGSGFIEGDFTVESATNLAILLRAGALPASIEVQEERTVGPDLGADSIAAGKIATIIAFVGILVFMVAVYGRFGLFANIALVVNVALIFGFLSMIGATLTLPGIAGIVLTIGMAVDANVLIFERIREELRNSKSPSRAIERGYEQAFSAIVDANITTFIAAVILFAMGSGPVKGFAVTLGVGIITSVFTATVVTRMIVAAWLHWAKPKKLKIELFSFVKAGTKINFMGGRKIAGMISAVLVAASIAGAAILGLNFGIDFRGGTMVQIKTEQTADIGQMRGIVNGLDFGDVAVQSFGSEFDTLIRVEAQETVEDNKLVGQVVGDALQAQIAGTTVERVEFVGPKVSGELLQAGIIAVSLAVFAVLVYIWMRFEWQFGLAAVVALAHDVALTIGVFEITGIEFNLAIIAALLTIVGYSLNDTVVVFDRVRENLRKYKQMSLLDLMNLSLNETLSRTLMTSITTLIALVAMFVLGPEVIKGFTFAMIWGVIVGTYSSVFVAVAALVWLGVKRDWTSAAEARAKAGTQFGGAQV